MSRIVKLNNLTKSIQVFRLLKTGGNLQLPPKSVTDIPEVDLVSHYRSIIDKLTFVNDDGKLEQSVLIEYDAPVVVAPTPTPTPVEPAPDLIPDPTPVAPTEPEAPSGHSDVHELPDLGDKATVMIEKSDDVEVPVAEVEAVVADPEVIAEPEVLDPEVVMTNRAKAGELLTKSDLKILGASELREVCDVLEVDRERSKSGMVANIVAKLVELNKE